VQDFAATRRIEATHEDVNRKANEGRTSPHIKILLRRLFLPRAGTVDLPFLLLVLTLVGFGLVMLYSASYAVALYRRGDAYAYIRPQLLYAALGVCGMAVASRVDYHVFHKLAWGLLAVSLVLLVVVLFMPEYNGCKRWLVLPGVGTLQPSEIAKFAVVLVFAHIISLNHDRMHTFTVGVLPFALVLGTVAALMLLEPHLSGTLLILGIGAVMMFVGGTGIKWFVLAGVGGVAAIAAAVVIMPDLVPYAADRLASWLDPFADPLGDGHQTIQSLYAIGSGGATGLGLGNSRQKHLFVPEPQNDFIFSILCEELGFVGACAVVLLFVLLLLRGITIAVRAPDRFGALLVVGFVVQVTLQAVLNIAVVTNTIPNTGISLPFFSSGGTSLMMLLGEMGIVLSVSRGET
jgi:cell division protein FtsW